MKFTALKFSFAVSLVVHGAIFSVVCWIQRGYQPASVSVGDILASEMTLELREGPEPLSQTMVVAEVPVEAPKRIAREETVPAELPHVTDAQIKIEEVAPSPSTEDNPVIFSAEKRETSPERPVFTSSSVQTDGSAMARPDYLFNPRPAYPKEARRQRQQGLVVLSVLVNEAGEPVHVDVASSSGHKLLDEAAISAVKCWRFVPARVGDSKVASRVEIPIRFILSA
jgi:protein TonB